jgi:hypothetical protein
MDKAKILHEAPAELQRHTWGTFVDKNTTMALVGQGIVTRGLLQADQYKFAVSETPRGGCPTANHRESVFC